jgi:hypothetical protein
MRTPWAVTLLILVWASAVAAEDERMLDEICGQTLTTDTVVRAQGGSMSFGDCALVLDNARLRILSANLAGSSLSVAGIGAARLLIVGTRLRADLAVTGDYQRVLLSNSLFFARSAMVDLSAGEVQIRFSTFRPGEVEVSTEDGAIRVRSTRFRRLATFLTRSGGADIRLSDFLGGVDVTTEDPGDLAFLSNTLQGQAEFRGDGKVAVAANTFELAPSGIGDVLAVGGDLAFINNLSQGAVSLQGDLALMVVGNTFESGRPSIDGSPPSCIIINNEPRTRCP